MDGITTIFIIPILLIALITVYLISKFLKIGSPVHRYSSIDGLRGFLAIFVFISHSALWYFRLHTDTEDEGLEIFSNLGPAGVSFFFMITSFLFFSKLIEAYSGKLDWLKLYVSRITRIMPLYTLVVFMLLTVVGIGSHFVLRESLFDLLKHTGQWMLFMEPDINKVGGGRTRLIIYGVQWSLAFEWMFYCSLPILGVLFFRIRTSVLTIVSASIFLIIFLYIIFEFYNFRAWNGMIQFLGGLPAAFLSKNEKLRKLVSSNSWVSALLLFLFVLALLYYPGSFSPIPFLIITVLFTGIACGNDLFGILSHNTCRLLGQISYSVYLLHGLVLFTTFNFVLGFNNIAKLAVMSYWGVICLCTIPLVIVTSLTFYFVEKPGIDSAKRITEKVKRFFSYSTPPATMPKADG